MPQVNSSEAVLSTSRKFDASPHQIYAAFENPELLARWWGPAGSTNTFHQFEFRPGGRWVFVMHGPNGMNYDNECLFRELSPTRIVIEHTPPPWFTLTVSFTAQGDRTLLTWEQEFENAEVASRVAAICRSANEENLDRLAAVLAGDRG